MKDIYERLMDDDVPVNDFSDTPRWLDLISDADPGRKLIALNFGETWQRCPPGLRRLLADVDAHTHGYQLSFYGDPAFRRYLKHFVIESESWVRAPSPFGADSLPLEVAVVWHGTRSAMYDFGCYLREKDAAHRPGHRTPYGLCPSPGWTYRGVFEAVGMRTQPLRLRPDQGFAVPSEDIAEAVAAIAAAGGELRWVVINAQQNPTGNNWSPAEIERLIDVAVDHRAALLVDNAYFGATCDPAISTSAMQVVLSRWKDLAETSTAEEILYVRSLGKSYHCNGWGLGVTAAPPETLRRIVHYHRRRRGLPTLGFLQQAMLIWLTGGGGEEFSRQFRSEHATKCTWLDGFLSRELGYPSECYHIGTHAPYALIRLPPAWEQEQDAVNSYLDTLAERTGVLLAPCFEAPSGFPWIRVYLGAYSEVIEEAFSLLAEAGFHYLAKGTEPD